MLKGHVIALCALTSLNAWTANDALTLSAPAASISDHHVSLIWNAPEDIHAINDYQILQNGQVITPNKNQYLGAQKFIHRFQEAHKSDSFTQKIIQQNITLDNLTPNRAYHFQVKVLGDNGQVLATSNTLDITTKSKPPIINIADHGAIGDGKHINTQAIQKAINSCTTRCVVEVPAGTYYTGALFLHSNMTFKIDKGAKLIGSPDAKDYPLIEKKTPALINIRHSLITPDKNYENIRIVGQGIIDGNGWKTIPNYKNYLGEDTPHYRHGSHELYSQYGILAKNQVKTAIKSGVSEKKAYSNYRSNLMYIRKVKNFYMQGVTLRNPSYHGIVSSSTKHMTLNQVTIETYDVNNGDGIDVSRSKNTIVYNSYFDVGDDAINFAAGAGEKAATQHGVDGAWPFNNFIAHAHGGIVTGSRTGSGIENILAENNIMVGTDVGLRAKSSNAVGGGANNVTFRNTAMQSITRHVVEITLQYGDPNDVTSYEPAKTPAQFKNFYIKNISVDGMKNRHPSIYILGGFKHHSYHKNLHFNNMRLKHVNPTDIQDLHDSDFNNITFIDLQNGSQPWHFKNVKNVIYNGKQAD